MIIRNLQHFICLNLAMFLIPSPQLHAQSLTLDEFQSVTNGQTFVFVQDGLVYGIERYLPHNRVEWSFLDGRCIFGKYFEWQGKICFSYNEYGLDADRPPQCWTFEQGDSGLLARFYDPTRDTEVVQMQRTDEPLVCPGPEVGS